MKDILKLLVFAFCGIIIYAGIVGASLHIGSDGVRCHFHSLKYELKQFDVAWAQDAKPCCAKFAKIYERN